MGDQLRILKNSSCVNNENGYRSSSKSNKPLLEKKRRARINRSLDQLKALLMETIRNDTSAGYSKLEKADILELAVKHLRQVQKQRQIGADADVMARYYTGFKECAQEVNKYLSNAGCLDTDVRLRLMSHLAEQFTAPTQKTTGSVQSFEPTGASYNAQYVPRVHNLSAARFQHHPYFPTAYDPKSQTARIQMRQVNTDLTHVYSMKYVPTVCDASLYPTKDTKLDISASSKDSRFDQSISQSLTSINRSLMDSRLDQSISQSSLDQSTSFSEDTQRQPTPCRRNSMPNCTSSLSRYEENSQSMWYPTSLLSASLSAPQPCSTTIRSASKSPDRLISFTSYDKFQKDFETGHDVKPLAELSLSVQNSDSDFYEDEHDTKLNLSALSAIGDSSNKLLKLADRSSDEDSFHLKDDDSMWRPW